MATRRKRAKSWEFVVRRKGVLPGPLYLTFDTEAEGVAYCRRLEGLLDRGIVPDEVLQRASTRKERIATLDEVITRYLDEHEVGRSDIPLLELLARRIGTDPVRDIDLSWARRWVDSLKRKDHLAPISIRHYVGALARCLDWVVLTRADLLPILLLAKRGSLLRAKLLRRTVRLFSREVDALLLLESAKGLSVALLEEV